MSEIPEAVRRMFDGAKASAIGEWRGVELWQVVTLEAPAFKGGKVKFDFRAHVPVRPTGPAEDEQPSSPAE